MSVDRIIEGLVANWPRAELPARTIEAYIEAFETFPEPVVAEACRIARDTCTFFPAIAELKQIVASMVPALAMLPEEAWAEVQREARRVGFNRLPVFVGGVEQPRESPAWSSPIVAEAVETVGWRRICTADEKDRVMWEFTRTFTALRDREIRAVQRDGIAALEALAANSTLRTSIAGALPRKASHGSTDTRMGVQSLTGAPGASQHRTGRNQR